MRSYRHLWDEFSSFEHLERSWRLARRGKRRKPSVASFEMAAESHVLDLRDELLAGTYQHRPYHTFMLHEHGKQRLVSAADFRDRVVHHALYGVLAPIWEARFHGHTYACRVGKGTHRAIDRCQHLAQHHRYVLQCDIQQFFPAMDHAILQHTIRRHVQDTRLLQVIDHVIASGDGVLKAAYTPQLFAGDDLFALGRARGLPIGNLTSQFWANVYLHPLDLWVAHELKCRGYVRYCDDFLLFANDKATLHEWRRCIISKLAELRLTLHEQRAQVYPTTHGIPWLGWVVYPTYKLLKRRCKIAFARRYRRLVRSYQRGHIRLERLTSSIRGWVAHVQHGQTWKLRQHLFATPL